MITDLLATSAFGESSSAVSVCCTIFTEEELIEILSSSNIDIYCKRPFLKFFTWVYVNIQGPQKDERYSSYRSNRLAKIVIGFKRKGDKACLQVWVHLNLSLADNR